MEQTEERTLFLNGTIAEDSWYDDDVTPQLFKDELMGGSGNITVWINSPGGDCVAAAQIYNMLMDYPHDVTVKIDGIAASAASVIAMAGTKVLMSPVSTMMIHNPATIAWGDAGEMEKAIAMLEAVKDSIINAYEIKTVPRQAVPPYGQRNLDGREQGSGAGLCGWHPVPRPGGGRGTARWFHAVLPGSGGQFPHGEDRRQVPDHQTHPCTYTHRPFHRHADGAA